MGVEVGGLGGLIILILDVYAIVKIIGSNAGTGAKVLAAVPQYGLEAVLVAVELVLESGNPSPEHIENVLNRLKAPPPPGPVETHLEVSEAPIANTERYDSLREEVSDA